MLKNVVIVGLGEVGKPLLDIISRYHRAIGVDIVPPAERIRNIDVLHVCYPFQIGDFIGETARYIRLFEPGLTIINSTVAVGTTRAIADQTGAALAYSPVRGKHANMERDLIRYAKFIGGIGAVAADRAARHFESVGLKTKTLLSAEAAELAKLTETTYFGLLIAWAQEVERYADRLGVRYEDIVAFYDEIGFFPSVKYFPGIIGGHCVMPNIELLLKLQDSEVLQAIKSSNHKKVQREGLREIEACQIK